jgi:glycine/D-amino acid oxidase-like deaminating enzyme
MNGSPIHIDLDVAIIGGGVAGLWLANRLQKEGFTFALFEHKSLGSDQTMASQGMIHGGMKYTLNGMLTGASEAIADMPQHWRACLCGEGDVDLRNTRILSDHFFLWSSDTITARLTSFLASKATRGRVDPVSDTSRPPLLRNKDFKGSLYRLVDMVLDAHSLVTNLANNIEPHCFFIDDKHTRLLRDEQGHAYLFLDPPEGPLEIHAKRFIFTAGQGNAMLLAQLGLDAPAMQIRPLQQVMVKHHHPFAFFGHCLGAEPTPRLTISSHLLNKQEQVWYLGGSLAERGASMTPDELIEAAKNELAELIPWVDLSAADWATLPVNRAEPLQPNFMRPDNAFIAPAKGCNNLLVGWPTKLTLVPNLANQALDYLAKDGLTPSRKNSNLQGLLPKPAIAPTPWEIAFPPAMSKEEQLMLKLQEELVEAYDENQDEPYGVESLIGKDQY